MKVKEAIEKLLKCHPEAELIYYAHWDEYTQLTDFESDIDIPQKYMDVSTQALADANAKFIFCK